MKHKIFLISIAILLQIVSSAQSHAETIDYTYDDVNRLLTELHEDGTLISYSYDEVGNRTSKSVGQSAIISASAGSGGRISPSGSVRVSSGADAHFDIIPNPYNFIEDVIVDGVSVGPVSSYLFTNVTTSHSITALFIDNTPDTLIISMPNNPTSVYFAEITFISTIRDWAFECQMDDGQWTECLSPMRYLELTLGSHTFSVRAMGPTGAFDPTPARYTWIIDISPPVLAQITPVATPTKNRKPSYTFSSTEAGMITYGGSCASLTTSAVAGDNTIVLSGLGSANLSDGTYRDCTINVIDAAGNRSAPLMINAFVIDTTPPSDGTLFSAPGSGQATLSWTAASDTGSGVKATNTYKLVRNARTTPTDSNIPDVQCANGTQIYLGTALAFRDAGLTNGAMYDYRLCAYDNADNISAGATISVTPAALQGHMARNSYHLTPEGWLVLAYTEGAGPYTVNLVVLDSSAQPVPADQILGLVYNPLLVTAAADNPDITLIFDDRIRTAYIFHDASGTKTLTVIPNIELKPAAVPVLEAPSAVNFGTIRTGAYIDTTINVSNTGSADLHISSVTSPAAPFSRISENCTSKAVSPAGTCDIVIRFSPVSRITYTGSFTINSDGGNKTVLLQGAGGNR